MSLKNYVISSNVKVFPVSFFVEELGEILGIPSTCFKVKLNLFDDLQDYDKREFYFGIIGMSENEYYQKRKKSLGGPPERNSWSAGIFYIDDRLLHYYLACVLMPKFTKFSTITDSEMQILYATKHNIQVNWAYVILHHMSSHNEFCFVQPYAYCLSYIFRKNNIDLTNERQVEMAPLENEITPRKVCTTKMGVKYDHVSKTMTYVE